ncbi:hypothetical protein E0H73_23105 [Kribbella pittospori]|uniref:Uncharacterized protein n=1 Tax=Kribbella pittospori TaxID=722689 RepID=A0A4R0KU11_9ACTN|nr:hypothetical protein [Kribbella pittospori]TCC59525.1 hypothetical protein E0H73_23105 [Kribbella pittospori]
MVAVVTILFAFPLGFFLRNRLAAYVAYIAIFAYSFTFQTLYLLRAWVGDSTQAFPADPETLPLGYLAVTGGIYVVGFLLVACGHHIGSKRRSRSTAVDLDPAH